MTTRADTGNDLISNLPTQVLQHTVSWLSGKRAGLLCAASHRMGQAINADEQWAYRDIETRLKNLIQRITLCPEDSSWAEVISWRNISDSAQQIVVESDSDSKKDLREIMLPAQRIRSMLDEIERWSFPRQLMVVNHLLNFSYQGVKCYPVLFLQRSPAGFSNKKWLTHAAQLSNNPWLESLPNNFEALEHLLKSLPDCQLSPTYKPKAFESERWARLEEFFDSKGRTNPNWMLSAIVRSGNLAILNKVLPEKNISADVASPDHLEVLNKIRESFVDVSPQENLLMMAVDSTNPAVLEKIQKKFKFVVLDDVLLRGAVKSGKPEMFNKVRELFKHVLFNIHLFTSAVQSGNPAMLSEVQKLFINRGTPGDTLLSILLTDAVKLGDPAMLSKVYELFGARLTLDNSLLIDVIKLGDPAMLSKVYELFGAGLTPDDILLDRLLIAAIKSGNPAMLNKVEELFDARLTPDNSLLIAAVESGNPGMLNKVYGILYADSLTQTAQSVDFALLDKEGEPDKNLFKIAIRSENFLMLNRLCELFGGNRSFRKSLSKNAEQSSSEQVKANVRGVLAGLTGDDSLSTAAALPNNSSTVFRPRRRGDYDYTRLSRESADAATTATTVRLDT
jgi:hypothetical protein